MAHVDDLHWYDRPSFEVQHRALELADLVTATYAYDVRSLYVADTDSTRAHKGRHGNHKRWGQQRLVWLPHATTPQFFFTVQQATASLVNKVLLSG